MLVDPSSPLCSPTPERQCMGHTLSPDQNPACQSQPILCHWLSVKIDACILPAGAFVGWPYGDVVIVSPNRFPKGQHRPFHSNVLPPSLCLSKSRRLHPGSERTIAAQCPARMPCPTNSDPQPESPTITGMRHARCQHVMRIQPRQ